MHDVLKINAKRLEECLVKDRFRLRRQLNRLQTFYQQGRLKDQELQSWVSYVDQSITACQLRADSIPNVSFPDELPVSAKQNEIAILLQKHQVLVLCGETGSGKTTQLPKICLNIGRGKTGFIGHTQPRRVAARSVASRIAEELGPGAAHLVGCKVRFHDESKPETLIKLMTDGILLAEIQRDRFLQQYDTLIIDEAHERSLNIDFILGYLKWLLPKRPDLKLIITSATIDPAKFSKHFDNAPIMEVSGRTYPVAIRYQAIDQEDKEDETSADLQQNLLSAVDELLHEKPGDILIFLSGEREIRETTETLRKHASINYEILPLYSKLSLNEQSKVFKTDGRLRIVLATNVAETSLTVPGIRYVIDTGYARISRYSHRSKLQRLPIEKISQASANQRAGRCGRVSAGICIRLYAEDDYQQRPEFTEPEILRTNLASVILQMKIMGLGDIDDFPFVEPPLPKMIRGGLTVLQELNALDQQNQVTAIGIKLAKLPIDPKLARMLIAADEEGCLTEVTIIVAALSIQDVRERPADKMQQADQKHALFKAEDSDFMSFLKLWNCFEEQRKHLSNNRLRKYCQEHFIAYLRMREWRDIYAQILQIIKGDLGMRLNQLDAGYAEIHRALLTGLLSNIGFRHEQYEYLGARNLKFFIFPGSAQHKARPKWLVAAEQVETSKIYARHVAKIEPEWIERSGKHLLKYAYYDPHWEKKSARSAIFQRVTLFGITLHGRRKVPHEKIDPQGAREIFLRFALVKQDFHCNSPFFLANQKLLKELGYIQHKERRVDLVEDEEGLYQFYDERIPKAVVNGITFDQWHKKLSKEQVDALYLTEKDLLKNLNQPIDQEGFPDHLTVNHLTFPLQYRFEPGQADDGVTIEIPVHQLNQLQPEVFDWMVPGLIREKMIALVKTLPKAVRRQLVPVPDFVDRCLQIPATQTSLLDFLAINLGKLAAVKIDQTAWQPEVLENHLRMNFKIISETRKYIATGRDLEGLQMKYGSDAKQHFKKVADQELNGSGFTDWIFEDLPKVHQSKRQRLNFSGYPALIDEGESVGLVLLDTEQQSYLTHQRGLVKLFQLRLEKDVKYLAKHLPFDLAAQLGYEKLPIHPLVHSVEDETMTCLEDFLSCLFSNVFVGAAEIRSKSQFEESLYENKVDLLPMAQKTGEWLSSVMKIRSSIKQQLSTVSTKEPIVNDLQQQIDFLVYKGFMQRMNIQQLSMVPRYFRAMEHRLEKYFQNKQKDNQKAQEFYVYWNRYWDSVAHRAKTSPVVPEQESFRWNLEEFRVSLFAQSLKTAYPVSGKRLEQAWQAGNY